jgi:voltage-gated potassium channel
MSDTVEGAGKTGAFQIAVLVLTIVNLCALVADTVWVLPPEASRIIAELDNVVCVVFLVDFCLQFRQAKSKGAFLKWGWIDLLASIPNLEIFRWGRLARVFRIIRLLRGIRSVQKIWRLFFEHKLQGGAVSVTLATFLLVSLSSIAILICERPPNSNIRTAEDAIWWSFTTMTTVGYGDKYPVTTAGRAVGVVLMICGVGMFAGFSGLVASFFLGPQEPRTQASASEILARLTALEGKIDRLAASTKPPEHSN